MTEEVVKEEVVEEVQLTEVEQTAYKEGWRPEDEFEGDKARWIPADEFMRRKPLFEKIDEQKRENYHTRRELQEVKQTLKQLADHHKQVRQVEYERAIKDIQYAKKAALDDDDHEAVVELDEQLDTLKEDKREFDSQLKQEQRQIQPTPEYLDWVKGNSWYMQDSDMHDDADGLAQAYISRKQKSGGEIVPSEVYRHVTDKIKSLYPEKFPNSTGGKPFKPSPVDSGTSEVRPVKKDTYKLTEEEEAAARNFEKQGLMTRKEYIEELRKLDERHK